jgi:hypothetical protein
MWTLALSREVALAAVIHQDEGSASDKIGDCHHFADSDGARGASHLQHGPLDRDDYVAPLDHSGTAQVEGTRGSVATLTTSAVIALDSPSPEPGYARASTMYLAKSISTP